MALRPGPASAGCCPRPAPAPRARPGGVSGLRRGRVPRPRSRGAPAHAPRAGVPGWRAPRRSAPPRVSSVRGAPLHASPRRSLATSLPRRAPALTGRPGGGFPRARPPASPRPPPARARPRNPPVPPPPRPRLGTGGLRPQEPGDGVLRSQQVAGGGAGQQVTGATAEWGRRVRKGASCDLDSDRGRLSHRPGD